MARKARIESSENIYHVINRGNYRSFIFETEGAKAAFEKALFEACERSGWLLHAHSILSNHFHLCLETPLGNLSEGMRWLQGTFAARFNRYRREQGHLFQGRFKSLIVEPGLHQLQLVDYIHLNALRAGLEGKEGLGKYRWSSLWHFPKRKVRPEFFNTSWMTYLEDIEDNAAGWVRYKKLIRLRAEDDPKEIDRLEQSMTRGWCIGSAEFRKGLAKEYLEEREFLLLEGEELKEFNRLQWQLLLEKCMKLLQKTTKDLETRPKAPAWKLAIGSRLKRTCSVTNQWLSESLQMGNPKGVSAICGKYQREREATCPFAKVLEKGLEN
jgi:REP element-mobilizing transposase RayT